MSHSGVGGQLAISLLIVGTMLGGVAFAWEIFRAVTASSIETQTGPGPIQALIFGLCGSVLIFSACAHLLAHFGYVIRENRHVHTLPIVSEAAVGILIPSFREEPDVVHRTLVSAVLQDHPNKWVALLLDDPPSSMDDENKRLLEAGRSAPERIAAFLAPFQCITEGIVPATANTQTLIGAHRSLASAFEKAASDWPKTNHEERFFARIVLEERVAHHAGRAETLAAMPAAAPSEEARCLKASFSVPVRVFERKQFVNLSHAANKAMNLNTFIGLVGHRFTTDLTPNGSELIPADDGNIEIPGARYLLTLDADSVIVPLYTRSLVGVLETEGNERMAVAQTPYAAFPDTPNILERTAGATTDVQRILHQGFTYFNASFWVGANAVLRVSALEDIREEIEERGYRMPRFIQDRTVIEDTESTVDLMLHGWSVHNHFATLAYSATPPDFGSLTVQRRRWACGGLLILPKAIGHLVRVRPHRRLGEFVIRAHYLGSLGWAPMAVLILLLFPFDRTLTTWTLPLAVAPYFASYLWILIMSGYRVSDLARVYGLNLVLMPVNLSGASASLRQGFFGRKVAFQRTPKVGLRTATPRGMLSLIWLTPAFLIFSAVNDVIFSSYVLAAFAGVNGLAFFAAAHIFIGARETREDMRRREASSSCLNAP